MKFILSVLFVFLLVVGCSGDDDSDNSTNGKSDAGENSSDDSGTRSRVGKDTKKTIDQKGGELDLEEMKIEIPEGALHEEVEIGIKVVEPPVPIPDEYVQASDVYECTPHGTEFEKPVSIEISYRDKSDRPYYVLRLDDEEDESWEVVDLTNFKNGLASLEVRRFSFFVVVYFIERALSKPDSGSGKKDLDAGTSAEDSASQDDSTQKDGGRDASSDSAIDSAETEDEDEEESGEEEPQVYFELTVTVRPGGTVTVDPGDIDCTESASPCSDDFASGTSLTLTAVAEEGFGFSHWDGDCQGGTTSTEVVMDSDRSCSAFFIEISGDIETDDPPTSVVPSVTEDTEKTLVFLERSEYTLPEPLPFDMHIPGEYSNDPDTGGQLPAGLEVNVYFLHFDPVGEPSSNVEHTASITFTENILAIIFNSSTLDETDAIVGHDDVIYPEPNEYPERGVELSGLDTMTFHGDRKTISTDLRTSSVTDQARVITATNGADVPFLTSSNVIVLSTPLSSVVLDASEANSLVAFEESSAVTLAGDLAVDAESAGTYNSNDSLAAVTIPSDTVVGSYLVHFDPEGAALTSRSGTITFEQDILGVIALSASLDASDSVLGSPTTTYPASGTETYREYELASNEFFRIADDGRSIHLAANVQGGIDQVRIVLDNTP